MSKISRVRVSAPGKVILHGEHAVVHYKKAIAISVGLYTTLDIKKSSGNFVSVKFPDTGIDFELPIEKMQELKQKLGPKYTFEILDAMSSSIDIDTKSREILSTFISDNIKLVPPSPEMQTGQQKATESFLGLYIAIFHDNPIPISVEINTELPVGAGLGSSASFAVALAGGLLLYAGRISKDVSKQQQELDTVNRWAYLSEKFVHGSPSGIDNHVATYGGAVLFQRQPPSEDGNGGGGEKLAKAITCPEIHVILVNSKVPRSTFELVKKTAKLKEEQYDVWFKCMNDIGKLVEEAVTEIQKKKSINAKLFGENHKLLQLLGVSHPALDIIIDIGNSYGFYGKLTGAGGGGCAFIYIPSGSIENVEKLCKNIEDKGFALWDTKLGCDGIRVENCT